MTALELVCFDSGFSYKHFHAAKKKKTAAAHSWNKWHFITRSQSAVIDEILGGGKEKKASWIPSKNKKTKAAERDL